MSMLTQQPVEARATAPLIALNGLIGWSTSAGAFGLVGLSGIVVNQLLLGGLVATLHANYLVAAVLASLGSTTSNFVLTERWVFRKRRRRGVVARFLGYLALTLASTPVRLPILYVLTSLHGVHYLVSNLVAIVAVFGGRYLVSDLVIWGRRVSPNLEVRGTE
jgi:putative flippase GtrA